MEAVACSVVVPSSCAASGALSAGAIRRPVASVPVPSRQRVSERHGFRSAVLSHVSKVRLAVRAASDDNGSGGSAPGAPATAPSTADDPLAYKHLLLPIMDRNPFLNESTRQAIATAASMAKRGNADITVVVIDEDQTETIDNHNQRLESIRFHLAEGGFADFALLERLGEGKMPAAVVGEIADDLNLDLVVMSMEAIHHKHVDSNLLAEFVPCPVLLLPL